MSAVRLKISGTGLAKLIRANAESSVQADSPRKSSICILLKGDLLDNAAHSAATSPLNLRPAPTVAQGKAGNYRKGHWKINGIKISIENPAGSYRKPEWPRLQAHYGYVKGTKGADGDHVDIFLRPSTPENWAGDVYVIDQLIDGQFDEHKVMFGWDSEADARKAYLANYEPGWPGIGAITRMTQDKFKVWMETDTTQPVSKLAKEWTASTSATSGITAYGATGKRKRRSRLNFYGREALKLLGDKS